MWRDRVFVVSAIGSRDDVSFRPGLYGDGDASDDRSAHKWVIYALDKGTREVEWERVAYRGEPIDKRHIKSTYTSATPATDGRIVVWFGSQGVQAYDIEGNFLWRVEIGRLDVGAYDIQTFELGPASSPILWNGLVLLQCDTQKDSFILAMEAETEARPLEILRPRLSTISPVSGSARCCLGHWYLSTRRRCRT